MEPVLRLTQMPFQIQFTSVFAKRGSQVLAAPKMAGALLTCHLRKRALVTAPVSHRNATVTKDLLEISVICAAAQMIVLATVHATQHTQVPVNVVLTMEVRTVQRS